LFVVDAEEEPMSVSTYTRDARLAIFRGTAHPAVPANFYVSLHSADPGLTGASELSGNGYARVAVSTAAGSWTAPATNGSNREITNVAAVTFPTATGTDWATATYFGIWDTLTVGNFIRGAALTASKTVQVGDTVSFAAGALAIDEN
jgi:hypothetical protein